MKLELGARVRVVARDSALFKQCGTVVRARFADKGAYVEMDDDPPVRLVVFPEDPARRRWVLLYPDSCGPVMGERGLRGTVRT